MYFAEKFVRRIVDISCISLMTAAQKPILTPRLTKPDMRFRSDDVDNPHHAGAAYSSLLMVTE